MKKRVEIREERSGRSVVVKPDRQTNGRIAGIWKWPSVRVLEMERKKEGMVIWRVDNGRGRRGEKNGLNGCRKG